MFLTADMTARYQEGFNDGYDTAIERLKEALIEGSQDGEAILTCSLIAELMDIDYSKLKL